MTTRDEMIEALNEAVDEAQDAVVEACERLDRVQTARDLVLLIPEDSDG